jgi:hypothetical protein
MNQSGSTEDHRAFSKFEQSLSALGGAAAIEAMLRDHFTPINQAQLNILLQVMNSQLEFVQEKHVMDASTDVYCLGLALAEIQDVEFSNTEHRAMLEELINELCHLHTIRHHRLVQLRDLLLAACQRITKQLNDSDGDLSEFVIRSIDHAGAPS